MKRLSTFVGGLVGLLMLGGLAVALILAFGGQSSTSGSSTVFQSPIPPPVLNLVCSPAQRPPDQSLPYIPRPMPTPDISAPTPEAATAVPPERGPRVGPPDLLAVSNPQSAIRTRVAMYGDQLAISAVDADGWSCLFTSDLMASRSEQIATLRGGLGELVRSDRYLVWTDELYIPESSTCPSDVLALETPTPTSDQRCETTPSQHRTEMHVYDLGARREAELVVASRRFLDLDGNVLVWQEYRGTTWGIYGQDLVTGRPFTVTTQSASYPKVAGQWVAYVVRAATAPEDLASELHMFNRRTGEDSVLGLVSSSVDGGGFAIDGNSLAWVKVSLGAESAQPSVYELHVYDMIAGQDRQVNIGSNAYLTNLHLSDDLLLYLQHGWQAADLRRNITFEVFPPSAGLDMLSELVVFGNRLVWSETDRIVGVTRLYTSHIDRGQ